MLEDLVDSVLDVCTHLRCGSEVEYRERSVPYPPGYVQELWCERCQVVAAETGVEGRLPTRQRPLGQLM